MAIVIKGDNNGIAVEGSLKIEHLDFELSFPDFTRHFFTFYTALLYTFSKTILKE